MSQLQQGPPWSLLRDASEELLLAELGHLVCYLQRGNRRCRWMLPSFCRESTAVLQGHGAGDTSQRPQRLQLCGVTGQERWAAL